MNMNTPEAVAEAEVAQEPAPQETRFYTLMRPRGNWICRCGLGHQKHETQCVRCERKRQ